MKASLLRIYSQLYKAAIVVKANQFRLFDMTLYPIILLLSTLFLAQFVTTDVAIIGMIVICSVGWRLLYFFQMETVLGIMDEYWSNSLEHTLISPIRQFEIILAGIITAFWKSLFVGAIFLVIGIFFDITVLHWNLVIIGFIASAICGVILCFFSTGGAYILGSESYAFLWAMTDIVAVISGVFYPIEALGPYVSKFALLLPTTHAFNILKASAGIGTVNYLAFFVTALVWLGIAMLTHHFAFNSALKKGKLIKIK